MTCQLALLESRVKPASTGPGRELVVAERVGAQMVLRSKYRGARMSRRMHVRSGSVG